MSWQDWWEEFLDLVFPESGLCLLCWREYNGQAKRGLCPFCFEKTLRETGEQDICQLCGRFKKEKCCPNCRDAGLQGLAGVISVAPYDGRYRELIRDLKYGAKEELKSPLGYLMSCRFRQAYPGLSPDVIIPVPLEPQRFLLRGFNQSSLLAAEVARNFRRPLLEDCLMRSGGSASQTTLGRTQRLINTRGTFIPGEAAGLAGKKVLLVDDIVTTGATLSACAGVLQYMGAKSVWGLTWAAGGIC